MAPSSTRIRGIVFDKDGTLLDFHQTWIPAYRVAALRVCEHLELPECVTDLLSRSGLDDLEDALRPESPLACESNGRIAELWSSMLGTAKVTDVLSILESTFETEGAARAVPVPGLADTLTRLRSRGLTLGLATMDSEALAHSTLARFQVAGLFDFVCGYDSGYGQKPDPGMIEAFCTRTRLEPNQCVMVGDTPHDLHMGRAAGVALTVGVLSGASGQNALADIADHVLPDLRNLEETLDGWL